MWWSCIINIELAMAVAFRACPSVHRAIYSICGIIVGEVRRVVFHIDSTGIISELHFMLHWTTHCSMQIAISRRPGWCWWSIRQALSVCLSLTQTVTLSADP